MSGIKDKSSIKKLGSYLFIMITPSLNNNNVLHQAFDLFNSENRSENMIPEYSYCERIKNVMDTLWIREIEDNVRLLKRKLTLSRREKMICNK